MPLIGIDLGTTNSVIACYKEGQTIIIPNRLGKHLTPSVVSIDEEGQVFVGEIAKQREITYPEYTASIFKRSMGTKKEYHLGEQKLLSEELSSFVLKALKEDAEVFLKEKVESAVISVPAYFNDVQRKATERAAKLAGLKVERLINEPTAAAIAYGLHEQKLHTKFLVFDLGGGTFDISILERYKNVMEVRGVAGDNYLGGEDFTQVVVDLFAKAHGMIVDELSPKVLARIRDQAEEAKIALSQRKSVVMKCLVGEEELSYTLSLEAYEKACQPLLTRLRRPIERALSDTSIKVKEIDAVVLIGGATQLPLIRSFVGKLFGRLPSMQIDPNEAVAIGASIQAAMKARNASIKEIVLTDVCPYTLGTNVSIEKASGYFEPGHFCPIIERNTIIPVSRTERLYTVVNDQKKINVEILQGENRLCKDNIYLGEINVPVPPAPAGKEAVDIRYTYDVNGLLEVEVKVLSTGLKKRMVIEKNPGYMSQEQIEKRLKALEYMKIHPRDKEENKLLIAKAEKLYEACIGKLRIELDKAIQSFENTLQTQDEKLIEEEAEKMKQLIEEVEEACKI